MSGNQTSTPLGEIDFTPEHGGIAIEGALPERIADYSEPIPARLILRLGKRATDLRIEPDDFEERGRYDETGNPLGSATFNSAEVK